MFWEKFYGLCEAQQSKPLQVVKKLGIASGNITNWKNGRIPSGTNLQKIADYFGVSVDYLLGKSERTSSEAAEHGAHWEPINGGEAVMLDNRNMRMIPLFESVSAGFGAFASSTIEDYMPVYFSNPSEASETICIKVCGDSMYPKIEDGDIIQVHKQDSVDSGTVAVVLLDGEEGLVKTVLYGADWIELRSINPMYPPMRFEKQDVLRVRVVGLVTQIVKGVNGRQISSVRMSDSKKELLDMVERMDADQLKEFNKIFNDYMKSKEI